MIAFHYDYTAFSLHGRNRFPALYGWDMNWERFRPRAPDGHIFVNSGMQLEWITGGYLKSFYHEVYFGEDTELAKQKALKEGRSLWRVASTCFSRVEGNKIMKPFEPFCTE